MQTFTGTESEMPSDYEQLILPQVYERCPHLGTAEEPETALGYASTANHCYRLDDLLPVALGHQQDLCLTNSYTTCSVFCGNSETPVFSEARQTVGSDGLIETSTQRHWPRTAVFALLAFIILSVGFWQFKATTTDSWKLRLPGASFSAVAQTIDSTPTSLPSQMVTPLAGSDGVVVGNADSVVTATTGATALPPTVEPLFTATAVSTSSNQTTSPTETPSPTNSPVLFDVVTTRATLVPTATAASCGHPSSWYTYTVRPGDTASGIAQSQGLTLEELMLANCMTTSGLFWGQVLWLPNLVIVPTVFSPTFPTPGETAVPPQDISATPTSSLGDGSTPFPSTPAPATSSPTELPSTPLPPLE